MKVSVSREKLFKSLQKVASIIGSRSMLPVLGNVFCSAQDGLLTLTTTDLEIRISTSLEATVTENGATTIPAKKFLALVSRFSAENVDISSSANDHIKLDCGTGHFTLLGLSANDFPASADFEVKKTISIKENDFKSILGSVSYAVSPDDSRKVLTGVLLTTSGGTMSLVATDGKRLALQEATPARIDGEDGECIVPLKAAVEVKRIIDGNGDLTIALGEKQCTFSGGNFKLTTKLVEGKYPNYKMVIPPSFTTEIELPAEQLLSKIEMVSQVLSDSASYIILSFGNNELKLQASSSDVGEGSDTLPVDYNGEVLEISFNPLFLADPLRIGSADKITLKINDAVNPVAMAGREGFLYVIMPIRKK